MAQSIKKGKPCSLQAWWGDKCVLQETGLLLNKQSEVKEYLNEKLQKYRGELIEYYLSQNGETTDIHLGLQIE